MEDFDGVYQRYFPQVYRYLCALCRDSGLAEELAQETFVQALEHIERFRGEPITLRSPTLNASLLDLFANI